MVLGGLTGKAEDWAQFSDRWQEELQSYPKIDYFSTREAAALKGQFFGWPSHRRDAKVARLVTIAPDFDFTILTVSVDLLAFASIKQRLVSADDAPPKSPIPRRRRTFTEEPYFFLIQGSCSATCLEMVRQGVKEEIDLFFDDQDVMKPRVKEWYPIFWSRLEDSQKAIMPSDPIFRDDKKFMPLQVADFVAWVERADLNGTDHPFRNVCKRLKRIKRSEYCIYWTAERLEYFLRHQDGPLSEQEAGLRDDLRAYLGISK